MAARRGQEQAGGAEERSSCLQTSSTSGATLPTPPRLYRRRRWCGHLCRRHLQYPTFLPQFGLSLKDVSVTLLFMARHIPAMGHKILQTSGLSSLCSLISKASIWKGNFWLPNLGITNFACVQIINNDKYECWTGLDDMGKCRLGQI